MPPFVKEFELGDRRNFRPRAGPRCRPIAVAKQRADAVRNRELLLAVAKDVFVEVGPAASLDQIAKRAGVGIGTLYRHFPNRAAIVEALYRNEVESIVDAATHLSETRPPVEALREWLRLFVRYVATKRLVAAVLSELASGSPEMYASSKHQIETTIGLLIDRATAAGEICLEMDPLDLLRALSGVVDAEGLRDWEPSARRLIEVMIAGMRVPGTSTKPQPELKPEAKPKRR